MFNTLSDKQITYIIIRRYIECANIIEVYLELTDPDAWEKYGVQSVPKLSKHYFYKRVQRIPEATIEMVKTEWTLAVLDEPLARGRSRVKKLTEIIDDPSTPAAVKVAAVREIGQITGDEDAAIKALAKSHKTDVRVSLTEEMKEYFNKDINND